MRIHSEARESSGHNLTTVSTSKEAFEEVKAKHEFEGEQTIFKPQQATASPVGIPSQRQGLS
jgi:hypothetical protein